MATGCQQLSQRWATLLRAFLLMVALACLPARAYCNTLVPSAPCNLSGTDGSGCHELPEFWVINTHCAPRCRNLEAGFGKIRFQRYDAHCHRFVTESLESLLAAEAHIPTLFYVHGNYLDYPRALKSFWQVYHKVRCCPGPKRLICWSWPAQRVYRGLRIRKMIMDNLRIKVVYAEYQGYYLASLVRRMSPAQSVMLCGHSFGAIVVSSAAHWLGGGQLRGLTLAGSAPVERPGLKIALISGAFDNDALVPGYRYGQAAVAVEKMLITRNPRDSTLGIWKRISHRGCPAIGVTGLNSNRMGQYRAKVCQLTMTSDVHRSHFVGPHLDSARLMSKLCCLSLPPYQCPHDLSRPGRWALRIVREITGMFPGPSPCPLPKGARGHRTVISRTILAPRDQSRM